MSNTARLAFDVSGAGADLRFTVILDGVTILDCYPGFETRSISHDFDDTEEKEHVLEFHMSGKLPDHTMIDDTGNILQDRCIQIANFSLDEIELGHLFTEITQYYHDHNGTTDPITDKFYGIMGCNGRVEMRFSTPIYLWLLENM